MRILLLTPQLPYPPLQGTSLRNYHILRGLSERHELLLLSYTEEGLHELPEQLHSLCADITVVEAPSRSTFKRLRDMALSRHADMAVRLRAPAFAEALQALLNDWQVDVVQIEGIELAWIIPFIRQAAPGSKIVYDAHNAETLLQQRAAEADRRQVRRWPAVAYSCLQSDRLARYETWACTEADWVTAVSELDRRALAALAPNSAGRMAVIPNCVDVTRYGHARTDEEGKAFDVLFTGKMDYRPNVDAALWFADKVWPQIVSAGGIITWGIVGQKPHKRLQRLEGVPGVSITGRVPEILSYLQNSRVFIMPFRVGSGTRLKLIEALAAGKAVVTTPVGVEGFPVSHGREVLVAESEAAFAKAVLHLLADGELRQELGERGRRFAASYDWRVVVPAFDAVYEALSKGDGVEN